MTLMSKGPPLPPEVAAELEAALAYDRRVRGKLGLNITREWFERMVALEGDLEVGAGLSALSSEPGAGGGGGGNEGASNASPSAHACDQAATVSGEPSAGDRTPGPWSFHQGSDGWTVNGSGYRVALLTGGELRRNRANARLIAAAPDQQKALMACAVILRDFGDPASDPPLAAALDLARNALAKAGVSS